MRSITNAIKLILIGFSFHCILSFAQSPSQKILVLGDSLSAEYGIARGSGWVSLLQKRIQENNLSYQIVNASISGETTAGGLARIRGLLKTHQPHLVIIELGANDALRGLALSDTHKNLRKIIEQSKQTGSKILLLGMRIPPNYGPRYSQSFADLFQGLCIGHGISCVPFLLNQIVKDFQYFQADRIHPTAKAQPLILDEVWLKLKPLL